MPRARYQLPIRLHEVSRDGGAGPATEIKTKHIAEGRNVDGVLRRAREILEGEGREIRSLAMGRKEIVAVVWAEPAEKTTKTTRVVKANPRKYPAPKR